MFNALGNPEQDLAHFLSRCGETSKNGALCLRQFVQSLEGDAFVWYSKLPPGWIPDWDRYSLVARFHKHFYSTHRSVGVTELTEAKQRQHESVDDFIAIWINLELSCEQEFFEAQQLKMCINCFRYEVSHILASQTIQTFEELCSKAHDLEAQILRKKGKKEEGKAGTSATIAMVETNKANKAPVLA